MVEAVTAEEKGEKKHGWLYRGGGSTCGPRVCTAT